MIEALMMPGLVLNRSGSSCVLAACTVFMVRPLMMQRNALLSCCFGEVNPESGPFHFARSVTRESNAGLLSDAISAKASARSPATFAVRRFEFSTLPLAVVLDVVQ